MVEKRFQKDVLPYSFEIFRLDIETGRDTCNEQTDFLYLKNCSHSIFPYMVQQIEVIFFMIIVLDIIE